MLWVPGLGLGRASCEPAQRALPGVRHETALLPGYGVRAARGSDLGVEALGRSLVEQWLQGPEPWVLVGHSSSCQIVAEAARRAPTAVARLVLIGPTTDPRSSGWPTLAARWLRTAAHERPGQVPVLARLYSRTGLVTMARVMDAARRHDLRPALREAARPALVVRGPHDRICPQDWAMEVAAAAGPGSRSETLARGAHMVPLTHGDAVAAAIRGG